MTSRKLNGASVREIRKALGVKQDDLARRIDKHPAYLSNLESGAKQPSVETMRAISDALAVPLDSISYPAITERSREAVAS